MHRNNRMAERNIDEGTSFCSPIGGFGDDPMTDPSPSHHRAIFQALVHSSLQAWIMVGALMEEAEIVDENRGEILRAANKLPPPSRYGSRRDENDDHVTRNSSACAICLEDFKVSEWCQVLPECSHVFHSDCIDRWLASNLTCPTCRTDITE